MVGNAAYLVPPADSKALEEAIVTLLDHEDLRASLAAAGQKRVQGSLTWDHAAKKLSLCTRKRSVLTIDIHRLPLQRGMKVLDAGCGAGRHLCEAFRHPGIDVVGIDLSYDDLAKTRALLNLMSLELENQWLLARATITHLPFPDNVFDVVICSEVLEHIPDNLRAIKEIVRVLKPKGILAVSVPRFFPERVCWALSTAYHHEPGGHIRIYRKRELKELLEQAGTRCEDIRYRHALHAPYWWLRCAVGHKNEDHPLVKAYKKFLEWDIIKRPFITRFLDTLLNPILAKSVVYYLRKES